MKSFVVGTLALSLLAGSALGQVRISQVHAGSGTVYDQDFVELYNAGNSGVNLSSWSIKYTTGNGLFWQVNALQGTIAPHGYFLVGMGLGSGGSPLPPTDWEGSSSLDVAGGKMMLSSDTGPLSTRCPSLDSTVDLVLWGAIDCEGTPTAPAMNGSNAILRNNGGCVDTNDCAADFALGAPTPRNSASTHSCAGSDCNGNGIDDAAEIAANPSLDCNGNGVLDSCEVTENPSLDCNGNGIIDCADLRSGVLTDVNGNGVADGCEGAVVVTPTTAVTVVNAGVSTDTTAWRAQGATVEDGNGRTNPSYAAVRWSNASIAAALNSRFFGQPYTIDAIYVALKQTNDGSSAAGGVQLFYTNHDTVSLTPGNTTTRFTTFATNYPDRLDAGTWSFAPAAAGTADVRQIYSSAGSNTPGGGSAEAEIEAGVGTLTMLLYPTTGGVLAAYAGFSNASYAPPTMVIFASALPACGSADFNGDGDTGTDADIEAFFACIAGSCCATCDPHGADFNGDGDTGTDADIESFFRVLAGGPC